MEKAIRTGGTRKIQLSDVRILCDASGTDMEAIEPGGGDLSPLSTPLPLKSHNTNTFMTIYPDYSLLRIPPVELVKPVNNEIINGGPIFTGVLQTFDMERSHYSGGKKVEELNQLRGHNGHARYVRENDYLKLRGS